MLLYASTHFYMLLCAFSCFYPICKLSSSQDLVVGLVLELVSKKKTGNHNLASCLVLIQLFMCENPFEESGLNDVLQSVCDIVVIMWDIMDHKSEELHLPRRLAQN